MRRLAWGLCALVTWGCGGGDSAPPTVGTGGSTGHAGATTHVSVGAASPTVQTATSTASSGGAGGAGGAAGACSGCAPAENACCEGSCADELNDPFHCGDCGTVCPGPHPFCDIGQCGTPPCSPDQMCSLNAFCCGSACCSETEICCVLAFGEGTSVGCVPTFGGMGTCPPHMMTLSSER